MSLSLGKFGSCKYGWNREGCQGAKSSLKSSTLAEVRELIHGEIIELLNGSPGLRAENSPAYPELTCLSTRRKKLFLVLSTLDHKSQTRQNTTLLSTFLFKVFAWFTQREMGVRSQHSNPGHYVGKKAKEQEKSRDELGILG